jgi:hypothetical protein
MRATQRRAPDETKARHHLLLQLGLELSRRKCVTRLSCNRDGHWALTVGRETVFCAGAEGAYAYVTGNGLILSTADEEGRARAISHLAEGAAT